LTVWIVWCAHCKGTPRLVRQLKRRGPEASVRSPLVPATRFDLLRMRG
jgi:hypothetical protein